MRDTQEGEKQATASVWIVSEELPRKVLLVHHRKHNKWLQLGGHVEKFENPIEAAVRETREESGIDINFLLQDIKQYGVESKSLPVPQYILEEKIPATEKEPAHFHIDCMYVVTIPLQEVRLREEESKDLRWFLREETKELDVHENTRIILEEILS
jgi:8-oxo-dGTP pyrophosphatase MutT (NUDIX family)